MAADRSVAQESKKPAVLYIASPSFAGSTLVTALMAKHPEIATVGELKASALGDVKDYRCSCGAVLHACPFWLEFGDRMRDLGNEFEFEKFGTHFRSTSPLVDRIFRATVRGPFFERIRHFAIRKLPTVREQFLRIFRANIDAIQLTLDVQHGSVFLDGSKDPNRLLFLAESGLLDIRVLHLTRDGRGVSNSMRRHFGLTIAQAASEWKQKTIEIERTVRRIDSDRVMRVCYERFCEAPAELLDEIAAFCGIAPFDDASSRAETSLHVLGNNMRLSNAPDIVLDERWRTTFDSKDHDLFEAIAGDVNQKIGYESSLGNN